MPQLQRPPTLKEFVIHSLLGWREPANTLVDRDDESPTTQLRRPESEPAPPRSSRTSFVFDLSAPPPRGSRPSLVEPTPSAFTLPPLLRDELRRDPSAMRTPGPRARRPDVARPVRTRGRGLARVVLLALVVLAGLSVTGLEHDTPAGSGEASAVAP